MNRDQIRAKIYAKIDEIPTLPAVIPRLLRLMDDEMSSAGDVARAISHDPALTSKILKVANSAYYGFPKTISTLDKAVPLLGFNMVRSLALSIGVLHALPAGGEPRPVGQEGLWIHSLAVATAMEKLGRRSARVESREHLFIVGLLHDLGKVVFIEFFPELFRQAIEEAGAREIPQLHAAERTVIGFDHGEVGGMLLRRWCFPEAIAGPIEVHHRREVPGETEGVDLAALRTADVLAQQIDLGDAGNRVTPPVLPEDLGTLGIEEAELGSVREDLAEDRDGIHDFFRALS